jgi:sulfate permease, SulP family
VPGSGSVTRSPINYQAGAKTRFSGVIASIGVAIIVLLFAPLLHYMPRAALAGLLLITAARLIDIKRLSYAIKASRYDAGLVIITALVGIFVDLDTAVLLDPAVRAAGGQTEGTGIGGRARTGGPRAGAG